MLCYRVAFARHVYGVRVRYVIRLSSSGTTTTILIMAGIVTVLPSTPSIRLH